MNKLFAIYMCVLLIIIVIALVFVIPTLLVVTYMTYGFSGGFITILIITILLEPLAIAGSYELLTSIKDIYNAFRM